MRLLLLGLILLLGIACADTGLGAPLPTPSGEAQGDAFEQLYEAVRAEQATAEDTPLNEACATFKELVDRSWWSLVDKESHLPVRAVSAYLSTIGDKLHQDGQHARMSDAIAKLSFLSNIQLSRQGDRWQSGIIYGRQMNRLCQYEGYEISSASPDSIIENICGGHAIYFSDEQINPALRGPGYCSSG